MRGKGEKRPDSLGWGGTEGRAWISGVVGKGEVNGGTWEGKEATGFVGMEL